MRDKDVIQHIQDLCKERSWTYYRLAKEAEVKEMWLTHYSPSLNHPEEFMDEVREIFPNSIAAKDKRTLELTFSDDE